MLHYRFSPNANRYGENDAHALLYADNAPGLSVRLWRRTPMASAVGAVGPPSCVGPVAVRSELGGLPDGRGVMRAAPCSSPSGRECGMVGTHVGTPPAALAPAVGSAATRGWREHLRCRGMPSSSSRRRSCATHAQHLLRLSLPEGTAAQSSISRLYADRTPDLSRATQSARRRPLIAQDPR